jgi:hypothetical protein
LGIFKDGKGLNMDTKAFLKIAQEELARSKSDIARETVREIARERELGKQRVLPGVLEQPITPWPPERIAEFEKEKQKWESDTAKQKEIEEAKELGMHRAPLKARVKELAEKTPPPPKASPKQYRRPIKWTGPKQGESGLIEGMALRAALSAIPVLRPDLSVGFGGIELAQEEQRIFDKALFARAEEYLHYATFVIKDEMRHSGALSAEQKEKLNRMYWASLGKYKNYAGAFKKYLQICAKELAGPGFGGSYGGPPWATFAQHMAELSQKLDEYWKLSESEMSAETERKGEISTAVALRNVMKGRNESQKKMGEIITWLNIADGMTHNNAPYIEKMLRREYTDTGGLGSGRSETTNYDTEYDTIMARDFGAKTGQEKKRKGTYYAGEPKTPFPSASEGVRSQLETFFPPTEGHPGAPKNISDDTYTDQMKSKRERAYRALLNSKELSSQVDKLEFVMPTIKNNASLWYLFKDTMGQAISHMYKGYSEKQVSEYKKHYDLKRIEREVEISEKKKSVSESFFKNWTRSSMPVLKEINQVRIKPSVKALNKAILSVKNLSSSYHDCKEQLSYYGLDGSNADRANIRAKAAERIRLIIDESGHYTGRPIILTADEIPRVILIPTPSGGHVVTGETEFAAFRLETDPEIVQEEIEKTEPSKAEPFQTRTRQPEPKAEIYNANTVVWQIIVESCDSLTTMVESIGDSALECKISAALKQFRSERRRERPEEEAEEEDDEVA